MGLRLGLRDPVRVRDMQTHGLRDLPVAHLRFDRLPDRVVAIGTGAPQAVGSRAQLAQVHGLVNGTHRVHFSEHIHARSRSRTRSESRLRSGLWRGRQGGSWAHPSGSRDYAGSKNPVRLGGERPVCTDKTAVRVKPSVATVTPARRLPPSRSESRLRRPAAEESESREFRARQGFDV